ncbi:MAG: hypothetical protein JRN09_02875 [Nitrososphaerota archaeon]|nr:hypothetical protein [Nitrososphaerota archaeon]
MSVGIPQIPVVFGPEPLDSLDRQILDAICKHARNGQSFNKLVAEVSTFASRSTFALRTKRFEKLSYVESFPDEENRQMKRIRGKPMTLVLVRIASMMRSQCAELEQSIQIRAKSIARQRILTKVELDDQMAFVRQANDKVKDIFSLIGVYAVNLGEAVAGDFLLPMVIADFKKLNSALGTDSASFRERATKIHQGVPKSA